MIYEKISSFAILSNDNKIIPSPVFELDRDFNINVSLFHLKEKEQYALNFQILKETQEKILDATVILNKKDNSENVYNIDAALTFQKIKGSNSLKAGDYALRVILGRVSDKVDNNVVNVTTLDSANTYFMLVESEKDNGR